MMTLTPDVEIQQAEGGLLLESLAVGAVVEVDTVGSTYRIVHQGAGMALISGHLRFCPKPVLVILPGSITVGEKLVFLHPGLGPVATSRIREVRLSNSVKQ